VAQRYPPHCTLTGFFRRHPDRVDEVAAEVARVVDLRGPVPPDAVTVTGLTTGEEWVGLELSSPWLQALTADFERHHQLMPGDDPLRPKDWLHLSLAYGCDDLDPHCRLAEKLFATIPPGGWEVALWQRRIDGSWRRCDTDEWLS
jgi:ubiquitin-associated SH3 domain-containing protein